MNGASVISFILNFTDVFQPKTICTPMGIIPRKFNSLGLAVLEVIANKQTKSQTHAQTYWHLFALEEG